MDKKHALGEFGENLAEIYLMDQGLQIVQRNYENDFGEIDLIARHGETWVFIEVKTRDGDQLTSAAEAITPSKQGHMIRTAIGYIRSNHLRDQDYRFDVLLLEAGNIEWIPSAFEVPPYYTL